MAEEAILINDIDSIILKTAIAKNLYKENFEQLTISKILKISQPRVSNYINSNEKIPKRIKNISNKISDKIIKNQSVKFHTSISFSNNIIEGKYYIAKKNEIINTENNKIIDNLTEAFFILKGIKISRLIPKVKINIAMAKSNAKSQDDIASYLNGLIIADDIIISYNGINFGKSKHLSSLLLYLKEFLEINSIMNIAYIDDILNSDFNYSYLTKDFKLKDKQEDVDILLHKGDFGIEPCAYIVGNDAIDVVKKFIKIKEKFK
jgi:predicted fused transcriptional regulator/phosphomethylpyrimidine kinase